LDGSTRWSSFPFRNGNAFIHHPFHLLFAKERFQKNALLHRAKTQEFDQLAQVLSGERFSIHAHADIFEIGERPISTLTPPSRRTVFPAARRRSLPCGK
jgi:hypothetical protein